MESANSDAESSEYYPKYKSAFSDEIDDATFTPDCKLPSQLPQYDGNGDAEEHVFMFNHHMFMYNFSDAIKAKTFAIETLHGKAFEWFMRLPPASLHSYDDVCEKFLKRFSGKGKREHAVDYLYTIVQGQNETLRKFMSRFSAAMLEVDDLSAENICMILHTCLRHNEFSYRLAKRAPKSFTELMDIAQGFMWQEDFELNVKRKA